MFNNPGQMNIYNLKMIYRSEELALKDLYGEKEYLHLILLRHFAWLPWRDHVARVEERIETFSSAGCKVVVLSFGEIQVKHLKSSTGLKHFFINDVENNIVFQGFNYLILIIHVFLQYMRKLLNLRETTNK